MKKTIAEQLNIKDFPFVIKDKDGNEIYYEDFTKFWRKREYDSAGNKRYFEDSDGYFGKWEYDSEGICIYHEDQDCVIIDNRPKPDEIIVDGIKYKRIKE